jgi:chemotaxis protein histidine kinase CheA
MKQTIKDQLLKIYLQETSSHLHALESMLPALMQAPQQLDAVLRALHTIKGTSRMMGLIELATSAQLAETLLIPVRDKKLNLSQDILSLSQDHLKAIQKLLETLSNSNGSASS